MTKVGIVTFHEAINFGATLQAYALQEVINEMGNFDVYQINYHQPYITNGSKLININMSRLLRSIVGTILRFPASLIRNNKFKKFWTNYLNFSDRVNFEEEIGGYDFYVVGSDQVWNFDITHANRNLLLYSSKIRSNEKKISYAASIGKNNLTDEEKSLFKLALADFLAISVREDEAVEMLSQVTTKKIYHVLDPTLLLNKSSWLNLVPKSKFFGKKYILVYALEKNELMDEIVSFYKKKLNIDVIRIYSSIKQWSLSNIYSPSDFLDLFDNAQFVITNSFHGTAFAINFEKDFVTVPHKTRSGRMISILAALNLLERNIDSMDQLYTLESTIDFKESKEKLEILKEESLHFLKNNMNG